MIGGQVLLRRWAGLALDRSILDDEHTLSLLAIDDDWLNDAFLWRLRKN
jgi:hypothetical protein